MPFSTRIARRVWSTASRTGWEWEIRDASGRVRRQGWTPGPREDAAREAAADVRGLMQGDAAWPYDEQMEAGHA